MQNYLWQNGDVGAPELEGGAVSYERGNPVQGKWAVAYRGTSLIRKRPPLAERGPGRAGAGGGGELLLLLY